MLGLRVKVKCSVLRVRARVRVESGLIWLLGLWLAVGLGLGPWSEGYG